MATKAVAFPKTMGMAIDTLYTLRAQRLAMQKDVDALQAQETALADHIVQKLHEGDMQGSRGSVATASIERSTQAEVTDWPTYLAYLVANKQWEMVQKRVGITALRERWDNAVEVPGVRPIVVEKLHLTKASTK